MPTLGEFFEGLLGKVKGFDLSRALGEIGSGAVKIPLEGKYDALGKLEFFQNLKHASPAKKYSVVGGLLLLSAILDQNMKEDSMLQLAVKEIMKDAGPEMGKRIVNGDKSPVVENAEKYASQVEDPADKSILRILCAQKAEAFAGFWAWYSQPEQEKRRIILAQMREHGFTEEEIRNIPLLNPENIRQLFEDFQPKEKEPDKPGVVSDFLNPFRRELIERAKKRRGGSNE